MSARPSIIADIFIIMPLFSCAGTRPTNLGVKDSLLASCPSSAADAWRAVRSIIANQPRTKIIAETNEYLYAECSSAFFGFVDDLELHLRPSQNLIAVRSAARLGDSDFGVNRKRVENLRSLLIKRGVVR